MKIMLKCTSVQEISETLYRCKFVHSCSEQSIILELNEPIVPGTYYYLMLKGMYPNTRNNYDCVGDICKVEISEILIGVPYDTQIKLLAGTKCTS